MFSNIFKVKNNRLIFFQYLFRLLIRIFTDQLKNHTGKNLKIIGPKVCPHLKFTDHQATDNYKPLYWLFSLRSWKIEKKKKPNIFSHWLIPLRTLRKCLWFVSSAWFIPLRKCIWFVISNWHWWCCLNGIVTVWSILIIRLLPTCSFMQQASLVHTTCLIFLYSTVLHQKIKLQNFVDFQTSQCLTTFCIFYGLLTAGICLYQWTWTKIWSTFKKRQWKFL